MAARRLRPLVALLVVLGGLALAGWRWRPVAWVAGALVFLALVRGFFYVLGAKAAMADPDGRR